jgi:acetyltransferase-like isoleucine patch superfamily enzyme
MLAKVLVIRIVNYLTNHVVAHIPSYAVRRAWYSRVLGIHFGRHSCVQLGCYISFYSLRDVRRRSVSVGSHTVINRGCTLDIRGGVTIGENVSVSPEVAIITASHGLNGIDFPLENGPVAIGDHVWIGSRAVILPGVTLGRGSVVAAGAVVTRDVPPLIVVAGVPAKRVGERQRAATRYVLDGAFPLFE